MQSDYPIGRWLTKLQLDPGRASAWLLQLLSVLLLASHKARLP